MMVDVFHIFTSILLIIDFPVDSFFNSCFDTNNEIDYLNLNDLNDHPNQIQTITSIQPQQLIIIQPPQQQQQQQQDLINKNTSIYTTTNKINDPLWWKPLSCVSCRFLSPSQGVAFF